MTTKDTNPKDAIGSRKPGLSAIPMPALFEIGAAMIDGGCKYGRHNYRVAGVRASIYLDALMRHIAAWWEGEECAKDSKIPHLAHAIACMVILRDAERQGKLYDDRPPRSVPWRESMDALFEEVLKHHPNPKSPYTQEGLDEEASK